MTNRHCQRVLEALLSSNRVQSTQSNGKVNEQSQIEMKMKLKRVELGTVQTNRIESNGWTRFQLEMSSQSADESSADIGSHLTETAIRIG